ncbi:MAG: M1 family metallopeptidase [bacterium]|nr:M1 family metallopeptidase [bacterium]
MPHRDKTPEHEHRFSHRLPPHVRPLHYAITLEPDLERFVFSGKIAVEITISEPTDRITLHAVDLTILEAYVDRGGRRSQATWKQEAGREELSLEFPRKLSEGSAVLRMTFEGALNDRMHGFYRSRYEQPKGTSRFMAATQFEATDARRCFPCWDEPNIPATFEMTLIVPEALEAVSNMPPETIEAVPGGKKSVRFARTPVMSTYLVACIAGELEWIEAKTKRGVAVRVITTPGKKEQGRFALQAAVNIVEYFDDYFAIPYPLPKLDLIALPDFAAGAMENWGAVTFRETALLIDPEQSAASARQRVAVVVAHEIAHQWFGNLVTMDWWTHLWLNEGFATFIEFMAVQHLFPEWEIWTQFIADTYAPALRDDATRSTHAIEIEVKNPSEISQIFDAISYSKGAAILRMIETYLTPSVFQKGLRKYLKRHQYANASTQDLWRALEEASGKPVGAIMDTWTKQAGYPLISVQHIAGDEYAIRQERFIENPWPLGANEAAQTWKIPIPIGVTASGGREISSFLIEQKEAIATLSHTHGWIKLNAHQVAYLRVNYTPQQWGAIREAIRKGEVGIIDRFGIVSDIAALVDAGKFSSTQLLTMLEAFREETHYIVWTEIIGILGRLRMRLDEGPATEALNAWARQLIKPAAERLGWDRRAEEAHTETLLRSMLLSALGIYENRPTIDEAKRRLNRHLASEQALDPNIRFPVYAMAAREGDAKLFDLLIDRYRAEALHEEKIRYLRALAEFRDPELGARMLDFSLSADVRSQDTMFVLAQAGSNPRERDRVWKFFKTHWGAFDERYGEGGLKLMGRIIEAVAGHFADEAHAGDIEQFFAEHPAPSASRSIEKVLEHIRVAAAWRARDGKAVEEWLATKTYE